MDNKKSPSDSSIARQAVQQTSEIFLKKLEAAKTAEEEDSLKEECRDQLDSLIINRTTGPALTV